VHTKIRSPWESRGRLQPSQQSGERGLIERYRHADGSAVGQPHLDDLR
jgi:hypothetical protein